MSGYVYAFGVDELDLKFQNPIQSKLLQNCKGVNSTRQHNYKFLFVFKIAKIRNYYEKNESLLIIVFKMKATRQL